MYRHLKEHGMELPAEIKGCFLCLNETQEALVLTSSNGSLKHKDVLEAVSRVLPEGKCSVAPRAKCISTVEDGDHAGWVNTQSEVFEVTDSVNDVFEAIAEYVQDHDGDYEDGLEVFKSYSEIRRKVQSQKESGQRLQALSSLQLRSNGGWLDQCRRRFRRSKGKRSVISAREQVTGRENALIETKAVAVRDASASQRLRPARRVHMDQVVMRQWWQTLTTTTAVPQARVQASSKRHFCQKLSS